MNKTINTKILCIGDPHFKVSNIDEVNIFIERISKLIEEIKPEAIIMMGDLLDTHEKIHSIPLNKAYEFIDKLRKTSITYCIVGNHDYYNNSQFLTENHWLNALKEWKNVVVVDKVLLQEINGFKYVLCPYVYPGRFKEAMDTLDIDLKEIDCIFAHQEFYGCKMGAITSIEGDKWELSNPLVISGHIHSNQKPQDNIYYPGSSMQHAFGESDRNIIPIVKFEKKNIRPDIEEIDLGLPRKKIIYKDMENIKNFEIKDTEHKIKLSISGCYEEFKSFKKSTKYKEFIKKGVKVIFKPKKIEIKQSNKIDTNDTSFTNIISLLVKNKKDVYLYQVYEEIINNKKISVDDMVFL
jgi:DNA repair exonuclease SbcCD nuclease subunit